MTNAQYDAAGNMTTGPDGTTYTYDADGNVISSITTTTNPITTQNQYDALNQRVKQTVSSTVTIFSFNPAGQRVAVYDGSMNLQRQQIYLDSKPVAFLTGAGNVYYQYLSGNGSKRIENDFDSNVGNVFNWSTWGDNLATYYGSDMDQYHYAMLDEDPDGTQHATFRNYNPNTAQWLSPDPYNGSYHFGNPQSFDRYAYAGNSPFVYVDPSGLYEQTVCYTDYSGIANSTTTCFLFDNGVGDGPSSGSSSSGASASGGGGAPSSSKLEATKQKLTRAICKSSPTQAVVASAFNGAVIGGIQTGLEGAFFGAFGGGVGAIPGGLLGLFVGGVVGGAGGVLKGGATALACSAIGAYGG